MKAQTKNKGMLEILKFVFSGFWIFAGVAILFTAFFGGLFRLIFLLWNRFFRHMNIRKHGYPPIHCDADGDAVK